MLNGITVVVPSANERRNLVGINEVTWSFPVDVVMVEQCLCVSPACTWAMFAGWLNLEELIVLAESMMRRDGRLRRTTIEELTAYLDSAREFTEAVFEETGRRPNMFRGYANCRRALRVIQEGTDSSMETRNTPNGPISINVRPLSPDHACVVISSVPGVFSAPSWCFKILCPTFPMPVS